ncbi:MAG: TIGR04211 family SH3 domain-containing protein [Methylococcales bacterium]|nr:TIGR04211 family SH3 domain-containing protein [Methylococcales bacterium]MBT7410222.1 TIGR04211 family SH3 domain-containing protein [Methylococcales bacterium]
MKNKKYSLIFITILLFFSFSSSAEEFSYITDICKIPVRSGQSTRHKILRMLKSGTAVSIIEKDATSGYSHITSATGKEGWVLSRQLMRTPSAREQIKQSTSEVKKHQNLTGQLNLQITKLEQLSLKEKNEKDSIILENIELKKKLNDIQTTASDAIRMSKQLKAIQIEEEKLNHELEILQRKNKHLTDSTAMNWFIIGACAIGIGILIGIVLPRLHLPRKSSWDSFS